MIITSLDNPKIKYLSKLKDSKTRKKELLGNGEVFLADLLFDLITLILHCFISECDQNILI